jgi:hypothetical protein
MSGWPVQCPSNRSLAFASQRYVSLLGSVDLFRLGDTPDANPAVQWNLALEDPCCGNGRRCLEHSSARWPSSVSQAAR